jgi:hypothetical protein
VIRTVQSDGHPLAEQFVDVRLLFGDGDKILHLKTNSSGEARVSTVYGKPDSLEIAVAFSAPEVSCAYKLRIKTEKVLEEGVVSHADRDASGPSAAAGQIVLVARPRSRLQKVAGIITGVN